MVHYLSALHNLERLLKTMRPGAVGHSQEYTFSSWASGMVTFTFRTDEWIELAKSTGSGAISSPEATPLMTLNALTGTALAAVQEHDVVTAQERCPQLRPFLRLGLRVLPGINRLLGLLKWTAGEFDEAVNEFEEAQAYCRQIGCRPELAWTLHDYADMLLERDANGDREKATAILDESLQISTELGMRPLMDRVRAMRDGLGA
ncbi:MAG: tetratricopeptide repeat protein [SAR202 cluster bacterium]|nr:tetratricopeptide repeat protein [SAR202 cluster bacterium]MQG57392.1 tetratricopeptide repeat protein [SAR202 cluster bacterium]MQG67266.1 tetratricopeptide repeat protein [SAR202 cluster bacterium]